MVPSSLESKDLIAWAQADEKLVAPMPAWYEFICGPVTKLKRSLRIDAMIAATAIVAGAKLATNNRTNFNSVVPHGLKLV